MPPDHVLVLLVPANLAKVLGGYITRWGTMNTDLIVVDEVPKRDAQFVRLGRVRQGVVPLWLYAAR
jgi:ethanolamine utilization protein EutA